MKDIDKYRGCMLGGAVGDALGYAVEFLDDEHIFKKFGENGIAEYELNRNGKAEISDDTQMSLFTANGLLLGTTRGMMRGIMGSYQSYIALCYKDWLKTQTAEELGFEAPEYSWLNNIPDMNHSRDPGRTCIRSLMHNNLGSVNDSKNNSKGCGGVMRVAPIGLYLGGRSMDDTEVDMIGAEAAALTHGHDLGFIPAAALVHIINSVSHSDITLSKAVAGAKEAIIHEFPNAEHITDMVNLIDKAVALSEKDYDDLEAIRKLGQGWVAEETLAIAIYCALKYPNDFEKAIIASVNHGGDSDSTGAVTGNILGAYLGMKSIPEKFFENLELKDTIIEIADDLYNDCQMTEYGEYRDPIWIQKYIEHSYPNKNELNTVK
ncbi:MAG: ADP-ribosylglycohydrolase family protein [Paludibacter sp.]|nr:ADP-ribosylglycohydrolase family protein [Paludibacter sp.]